MPVPSVKAHTKQIVERFNDCAWSEKHGGTSYDGGSILDPQTGKTYKLKGNIAAGGKN